ncbi:hypothetical protein BDB00DRAFT_767249, partial [Zychaea mexicana]|uniref:uncharacterized protein n=1 Tax=Zychaea mexicana TaxID=64656 RepID=UPI0022FE404E
QIDRRPEQVPYHTPMDPIRFLLRSAMVYRNKTAVIHGDQAYDYETLADRVLQLANVLIQDFHVRPGDRVAVLCQNTPAYLEATFAVPAAGCILVPLNTRLAPPENEYLIKHCGATVLIIQEQHLSRITPGVKETIKMIRVADQQNPGQPSCQYELLLQEKKKKEEASGTMLMKWNELPLTTDENALITINYTSGSAGKPKGVMQSYRSCYLMAMNMCVHARLTLDTKYLWTAPMFHCNGWNFTWAVVAVGGTHVMLDKIDYPRIWKLLQEHRVTHYGAAPTVQNELAHHKDAVCLDHPVSCIIGGSPLSSKTSGPSVHTYDRAALSQYPEEQHAELISRQGFSIISQDETRVLDPKTGKDVVANGKQVGEICSSGNTTMLGYYNDVKATKKAFQGGVFWSGDLGVRHPDGAVEVIDRAKDVVVSGGENISSIEVENTIMMLEVVSDCAIVGGPDEIWGERPFAYIVVWEGKAITAEAVIFHCRRNLAGYKCPSKIIFVDKLPKTE